MRAYLWPVAVACAASLAAPEARAQADTRQQSDPRNDVVMRAMRDELARSMEALRLDTLPKPYFIAYRVTESEGYRVAARLGSLLGGGEGARNRFIQVEVRVGDYAFDNTNFMGSGFMGGFAAFGFGAVPVDDDYQEIRRQLWLSTDRAYKQALEALSQKRASLESRMTPDSTPDFSRQPAHTTSDEAPPAPINRAEAEALVRALSNAFRGAQEIQNSGVNFTAGWSLIRYANSEGTSFTRAAPRVSLSMSASGQAEDGMSIGDAYSVTARSQAQLPGRDSLMSAARGLASGLTRLRRIPLADSYEGPVLFEGTAAAELFAAVIAPKMIATRRPVANVQFERAIGGSTNDWMEMVGSPVLPRFLSVVNDPAASSIDGVQTLDGLRVDDDGIPTRATTVVERGMLKALLTTRVPVSGVELSPGNRRGSGPAPSQVIVTAHVTQSASELKRRLLELATAQGYDYAIIVRRFANARGMAGLDPMTIISIGMMGGGGEGARMSSMAAFKLYPDGREEPIRAAEISGVTASSFRTILGASDTRTVHSVPFSAAGALGAGGGGSVTYAVPSLLFANASLRRPRGGNAKLPLVPPPQ